ncbi:LysR family transcriptional regulator [Angelakisella massiliensis]|uniref:LysR family transcriptional regulator n=1 Tax=Angelakisella massiliensis TaxID=1871018 RepID=UPI0008F8E3E5|nr:LysR family transcriptional regulator [Angelakisella massiliensis]
MDLNRMKYIITVARTGNISQAARELYLSQPALTKAIQKTEEELGVRLFERDSLPLRLTFAGERYVQQCKKILNIQRTLTREMQDIAQGKNGRIVVGIPRERGCLWLPHILPDYCRTHPEVEIIIKEGTSQYFEEELLRGNMDFCVSSLPVYSEELDYEIVCDDPILLVVPQEHPLSRKLGEQGRSPLSPCFLPAGLVETETFLTLTPEQGMYRTAQELFIRHGIQPQIRMRLRGNETAYRLSTAGMGLMFTPLSTTLRTEPVSPPRFATLDQPLFCRKIIIAHGKGDCLSQNARDLVDLTVERVRTVPELSPPLPLEQLNRQILFPQL